MSTNSQQQAFDEVMQIHNGHVRHIIKSRGGRVDAPLNADVIAAAILTTATVSRQTALENWARDAKVRSIHAH